MASAALMMAYWSVVAVRVLPNCTTTSGACQLNENGGAAAADDDCGERPRFFPFFAATVLTRASCSSARSNSRTCSLRSQRHQRPTARLGGMARGRWFSLDFEEGRPHPAAMEMAGTQARVGRASGRVLGGSKQGEQGTRQQYTHVVNTPTKGDTDLCRVCCCRCCCCCCCCCLWWYCLVGCSSALASHT
jgi:hypothetical protein